MSAECFDPERERFGTELPLRVGALVLVERGERGAGVAARNGGSRGLDAALLPPVPLRQWVFTLPHPLRARLAYDAPLLGAVTRLFVDTILGWYQRHLRTGTRELAQSGAVVAVQRASSAGRRSGLRPRSAGPELRRKPRELAFAGRPGVVIEAPLSVREAGFSLHAATRAGAFDEPGRQALLKYILRPPLTSERLLPGPDGLVRIALKKPFSDGTVAVDLDPLALLCRLVALAGERARLPLPSLGGAAAKDLRGRRRNQGELFQEH